LRWFDRRHFPTSLISRQVGYEEVAALVEVSQLFVINAQQSR
jgi:hypothetical protein